MVPGRMALLMTLFLTEINLFISATADAPKTNSVKNVTAWMMACMFFVYCALIEYGCTLFYKSISEKSFFKKVDLYSLVTSILAFIVFNLIFWTLTFLK